MNMTYDGWLVSATDDGWVVLINRELTEYHALQLNDAEVAPAWNQHMLDIGRSQGAATWVRNGPAIDNDGDISVVFDAVIDPASGAPFSFTGVNVGSGSTASLMGFDEEDQFVVITDGDEVMNMVLFWRNQIPADWEQLPNAPSRRIAGMARAEIGRHDAEAVQTEQSVVVGGYGALVVNTDVVSQLRADSVQCCQHGLHSGCQRWRVDA